MHCKPIKLRNIQKQCFWAVFHTFFRIIRKTCTLCLQIAEYGAKHGFVGDFEKLAEMRANQGCVVLFSFPATHSYCSEQRQKQGDYAFPAFSFNNTCTPCHQMAKHRENIIFLLFFGHIAIDCKNGLFWGLCRTFENMRTICTEKQQN